MLRLFIVSSIVSISFATTVNVTALNNENPSYMITTVGGQGTVPGAPNGASVNYENIPVVVPEGQCVNKNLGTGGNSEKLCCTCGPGNTPVKQTFVGRGCNGTATNVNLTEGTYSCGGSSQYSNTDVATKLEGQSGCGQKVGTVPMVTNVCVNERALTAAGVPADRQSAVLGASKSYRHQLGCLSDGNLSITLQRFSGSNCNGTLTAQPPQQIGSSACVVLATIPQGKVGFVQIPKAEVTGSAKDFIVNGIDISNRSCIYVATSTSTPTTTTTTSTTKTTPKSATSATSATSAANPTTTAAPATSTATKTTGSGQTASSTSAQTTKAVPGKTKSTTVAGKTPGTTLTISASSRITLSTMVGGVLMFHYFF